MAKYSDEARAKFEAFFDMLDVDDDNSISIRELVEGLEANCCDGDHDKAIDIACVRQRSYISIYIYKYLHKV